MKKFVFIIMTVLILSLLAWVVMYMYGQTRVYAVKETKFFTGNFELIAHRGGALEAPENTLQAFDHAVSISPNVILELDIHYSSDKQIVIFHDSTLERTTNSTGPLKKVTFDELRKLDAGYNFKDEKGEFSYRGKGIQIPTLVELFGKYPDTRMIIEIKPNERDLAKDLYDLAKKYNRIDKTIFASEHSRVVQYLRSLDAEILTNAGQDEILRTLMLINARLGSLDNMKADVLCIPEEHSGLKILTPELLVELEKRHKKAYIWTVNEMEDMKRLISQKVHGIITDRPKALSTLLLPIE